MIVISKSPYFNLENSFRIHLWLRGQIIRFQCPDYIIFTWDAHNLKSQKMQFVMSCVGCRVVLLKSQFVYVQFILKHWWMIMNNLLVFTVDSDRLFSKKYKTLTSKQSKNHNKKKVFRKALDALESNVNWYAKIPKFINFAYARIHLFRKGPHRWWIFAEN